MTDDNTYLVGRSLKRTKNVQLFAANVIQQGFQWYVAKDATVMFVGRRFTDAMNVFRALTGEKPHLD